MLSENAQIILQTLIEAKNNNDHEAQGNARQIGALVGGGIGGAIGHAMGSAGGGALMGAGAGTVAGEKAHHAIKKAKRTFRKYKIARNWAKSQKK